MHCIDVVKNFFVISLTKSSVSPVPPQPVELSKHHRKSNNAFFMQQSILPPNNAQP